MTTSSSQAQKLTTQDALIQGIPTALMTQNIAATAAETPEPNGSQASTEQKFEHSIDLNYQPEFRESEATQSATIIAQFNLPKLRRLLKQYG